MKPFHLMKRGIDFVYPLKRGYITDTFRMPARPGHLGPDLCCEAGDEVVSAFPGVVYNLHPSAPPGGITVEIRNDDENTCATYSHLIDPVEVKIGQRVAMGQLLGYVAALPADKPRPHVHFQLRAWIDPEKAFNMPKQWAE